MPSKSNRPKADPHQAVTDAIIDYLEKIEDGTENGDWTRPWTRLLTDAHYCPSTEKAYNGFVNIMSLSAMAWQRDFSSMAWGTFKQWKEMGTEDSPISVRKGAKACHIFVPMVKKTTDSNGDEEKRMFFKTISVFNADDVEGYTEVKPELPASKIMEDSKVDSFVANLGIDITHGGDKASYSSHADHVRMPVKEAFNDTPSSTATEAYYGTMFHELTHGTGHDTRCKRPLANIFGSAEYAKEELIAEMGAAILCHMFNVSETPRANHAQYIKSWLKALKNDKNMIFMACRKAQQAIKWMEGKQPGYVAIAA